MNELRGAMSARGALVVVVEQPTVSPSTTALSLAELEALLRPLGVEPRQILRQKRSQPHPDSFVGAGKLKELATAAESARFEVLVADDELSSRQRRSLSIATGLAVWDRADVVLRTFETRAQTPLAKAEVELARLTHELAQVRDDDSLGDKEGGGGRGGRGHSNVELRKQAIRRRIAELRRQTTDLWGRERTANDDNRVRVALVGYTNAGKSTWLNALTSGGVLVADQLFATLGTTTRRMQGMRTSTMITDTVGFLQRIPHELVASFHATLMEAADADLLVKVFDAADPAIAIHASTIDQTLAEIRLDAPCISVLNKWDLADSDAQARARATVPDGVPLSAVHPEDVESLRSLIERASLGDVLSEVYRVPWELFGVFQLHRSSFEVLREEHGEHGLVVELAGPPRSHRRLRDLMKQT